MAVPPDLPDPDATIALARRWANAAAGIEPPPGAERLAGLLADPGGLEFALGFIDRVVRPRDPRVAARDLEQLSRTAPQFLSATERTLITLGGGVGVVVPQPVIPLARRVLRRMVSHLVLDGHPTRLTKRLAELRATGAEGEVAVVGDQVGGDREATRRMDRIRELIARDDVTHLSLRIASVVPRLNAWGFERDVADAVAALLPLYRAAAASGVQLTLQTGEYRDLDLTLSVLTRVLDDPELRDYEGGIVLPAYLPDSVAALARLTEWAQDRVADGGGRLTVRLVKGANLATERVDAAVNGWALAPWRTKTETDTNLLRLLSAALTPEATAAMRVTVASHNLFTLAFARLLAEKRDVTGHLTFAMLLGMADPQADAILTDGVPVILSAPVVTADEFDTAIGYLVRRLDERVAPGNFLAAVDHLDEPATFEREASAFTEALAEVDDDVPPGHRTQNRLSPALAHAPQGFRPEPRTDPSLAVNRHWARGVLDRVAGSEIGVRTADAALVSTRAQLEQILQAADAAATAWASEPLEERVALLRQAADVLSVFRGRFIEVRASEAGTTIPVADAEASAVVDFARASADRIHALSEIRDARITPAGVVLVMPSVNAPLATAADGVLSALAAGNAVILAPADTAWRAGAVIADALWEAGVPPELLHLVIPADHDLERLLVTSPKVARLRAAGSVASVRSLRVARPELAVQATPDSVTAIIVTASADTDRAIADIVESAFRDAGQAPNAASLMILVGSLADSSAFRDALVDAVSSLRVGPATQAATEVGPLRAVPDAAVADALTQLGDGESWLVTPRSRDDSGHLWSPGVRDGVRPGSRFHQTPAGAPVLGLMRAATLAEAIALQNGTGFGGAAGIQSLDVAEIDLWTESVQAGSLFVNRPTTGAVVRRQPSAGWGRSLLGAAAASGGPNTLLTLSDAHPVDAEPAGDLRLDGLHHRVRTVVEAFQPSLDYLGFDAVRRGALSDLRAWEVEFGVARDEAQLGVERNVLRYRRTPVTVRLAAEGALADMVRVLAAAARTRSPLHISSARPLRIGQVIDELGWSARVESDGDFVARMRDERPERIRLIGAPASALADVLEHPEVTVFAAPVTAEGRIEMLPFLREQSVSMVVHRYGLPDRALIDLPL